MDGAARLGACVNCSINSEEPYWALSTPTVTAALQNLEEIGLVREITGRQGGRIFTYDAYLDILARGTGPLNGGIVFGVM